jgi:hypothetical protein
MEFLLRNPRILQEMQSLLQKNQELQQSIMDLTSSIRLNRKNRFASTSQKSRQSSKKDEISTLDEEREDHDGTQTYTSSETEVEVEETKEAAPVKEEREYRKGMKYNTMKASRVILHKFSKTVRWLLFRVMPIMSICL